MPELTGYRGKSLRVLEKQAVSIGDELLVRTINSEYKGVLMPRYEYSDDSHIVLKLQNGYNIGLEAGKIRTIERTSEGQKPRFSKTQEPEVDSALPKVSIVSTGGTIASRIDYRTGGVRPVLTAEDLYSAVPELSKLSQIDCEVLFSLSSENMSIRNWKLLALKIAEKVKAGYRGVVVPHGTDTMAYTAAALSFALPNVPIPVLLVGAQRSSDRPSSDSATNLLGGVRLAAEAKLAGVYVVMHDGMGDDILAVHQGTKVRKNHTSRRDAFESVNTHPVAYSRGDEIEYGINAKTDRRHDSFRVRADFEEKVHLIKFHPNSNPGLIAHLVDQDYKGIVIEGTGLGHVGEGWYEPIRQAVDKGVLVGMTSQCIWGRVRMTVYSVGRELLSRGVVPLEDMHPETALVKMMWVLRNSSDIEDAKRLMRRDLAGEYEPRSPKNGDGK